MQRFKQFLFLSFKRATLVRFACFNFISELFIITFVNRSVLDNFHAAMKVVNDPDIVAVGETLQLAQDAILSDPKQLAAQFVARLYEVHVILMFFLFLYSQDFFPLFLVRLCQNALAQLLK